MTDKFIVVNDACELCVKEYIEKESEKIVDMPKDQKKTVAINKIIHGAHRASSKPVVRYPCREQLYDNVVYHNLCVKHLYDMIDAIKSYEDDANDLP